MKKFSFLLILALAMVFLFALNSKADVIGDVGMVVSSSGPTGNANFFGSNGTYYFDYDAIINGKGPIEAFCVENSNMTNSTVPYTLISLDSDFMTDNIVYNPERYLGAAWFAELFTIGGFTEDEKAAAQLGVWEIMFDGPTFNFSTGNFRSTSSYATAALATWNGNYIGQHQWIENPYWTLAVNPTIAKIDYTGQGVPVLQKEYQNFLVRTQPVPEPASIFLFGTGLISLGGLLRKKFGFTLNK